MYSSKKLLSIFLTAIMAISIVAMAIPVAVEAQVPYLTLSPTSGRGALGDQSKAFKGWSDPTLVTVTGYNFPAEQKNITLRIVAWDKDITPTAGDDLKLKYVSIGDAASVNADANGYFQAMFEVPSKEKGMYKVFAVYTVDGSQKTTEGALFEVEAAMLILEENSQTSTGVYNSRVHILLTGFRANEKVNIIPTDFLVTTPDGSTEFSSFTVDTNGATIDVPLDANVGYVSGKTSGGIKNVIVYGSKSGISATATFTLRPTIGFSLGTTFEPTVSIPAGDGYAYLWGKNWEPDTEIEAGTLKFIISDVAYSTDHDDITVADDGTFGPIKVSYDNLPRGVVSVELYGTTFSLSAENIIPPASLRDAQYTFEKVNGRAIYHLAGALVSSKPGSPRVYLSESTIRHDGVARTPVYVLAVGGNESTKWTVKWDNSDVTLEGMNKTDVNGAAVAFINLIPEGKARSFGDHELTFGEALSGATKKTLKVLPYLGSLGTRGYREYFTVKGYGFKNESITFTIGGLHWFTIPADKVNATDGSFIYNSTEVPKLPSGKPTVVAKGTTEDNEYSRTVTIKAVVIFDSSTTPSEPLMYSQRRVGEFNILRSSVTIGVFGLKANTVYELVVGGIKVASFKSTADGTTPGSISFIVPNLKSGLYYVDLVDTTTGKSGLLGLTRYSKMSTYRAYKPSYDEYKTEERYGDGLLLNVVTLMQLRPTGANVGTEVALTASGLKPSTKYYVTISDNRDKLSGPYMGFVIGEFTTTATGEIPAGTKVTIPEVPAIEREDGQTWYICASTIDQLGELKLSTYGKVSIYASASITPTRGGAGDTVTLEAKGLKNDTSYTVYFGFVDKDNPGTVVGHLDTDSLGLGSVILTVPSLPEGDYKIQLYDRAREVWALTVLPVFTIGLPPAPPVGTGTFTPSAPTLLDAAGRPVASVPRNTAFYVQVTLKSNVGVDVSTYVIAQIKDATGKIVALGTTLADVKAGATKSVPVAFLGVPAGTYTVTIYVWSSLTTPTALAPTTTFTITVS